MDCIRLFRKMLLNDREFMCIAQNTHLSQLFFLHLELISSEKNLVKLLGLTHSIKAS